jgi:hypothetical protein
MIFCLKGMFKRSIQSRPEPAEGKAARSEEDEAYEWYGESYELGERRWWPFSTLPIGIPRHRFPY